MFSLSYIETKSCREVLCRARTNDKKLARILTKSNLPSEGLFYKLGSYHQLPGSILPNPSPAEVYYPTLVQANGHHPSPVLSILPSAHCVPELAKSLLELKYCTVALSGGCQIYAIDLLPDQRRQCWCILVDLVTYKISDFASS